MNEFSFYNGIVDKNIRKFRFYILFSRRNYNNIFLLLLAPHYKITAHRFKYKIGQSVSLEHFFISIKIFNTLQRLGMYVGK